MNSELTINSSVAGRFKIVVIKPDGTERIAADWFPNLITNAGLNRIADFSTYMDYCQVGTGTATPQFTDTALSAYKAGVSYNSTTRTYPSTTPYFSSTTRMYQFSTSLSGLITEVGIGWTSSGNLFSRALILDGLGNPTSVEVFVGDTLQIYYELRVYPPTSSTSGTVELNSISYNWTMSPYGQTNPYTSTFAWAVPSNSYQNYTGTSYVAAYNTGFGSSITGAVTAATYVTDSFERNLTLAFGLTPNVTGNSIAAIRIRTGFGAYEVTFSPVIPKTDQSILSLQFKHTWGRKSL